jgi:hypothetical protein
MTYIPPAVSPQPPKKSYNLALVIGIVGCGAFLLFCIFVVAIFAAYKMGVEAGPRRFRSIPQNPGDEPPVITSKVERVSDAGNGWSNYKLGEFGIMIALPSEPKPVDLHPERWDQDLRDDIEAYSGLQTASPSARIRLEGYLYKLTFPKDDTWVIKNDLTWRHRGTEYSNVKQTVNRITVDGAPAIEIDYSYKYDGTDSREHDLVLVGQRSVRSITFSTWLENDDDARKEFDKCVASVHYLLPGEDKFGKPLTKGDTAKS